MGLIVDIRCYIQQEFSFLTLRGLRNLVNHGDLCVNITCKTIWKVGLLKTLHSFTSPRDPSFCLQILSLVFLSSLASEKSEWKPSCGQCFISYLKGFLLDFYFSAETKNAVKYRNFDISLIQSHYKEHAASSPYFLLLAFKRGHPSKLFRQTCFFWSDNRLFCQLRH